MFNLKKLGYYHIKVICQNCGKPCDVRIKKGKTILNAIEEKSLICDNCGVVITPAEYSTQWLK